MPVKIVGIPCCVYGCGKPAAIDALCIDHYRLYKIC